MELDTLKTIWREQQIPATADTGPVRLQELLRKKARGPIARIRRNLRIEGILILVTYIPCILIYLVMFDGKLYPLSIVFFLILFIYSVYFYAKGRLLWKMQCITCEVRSNLAMQVRTLGKYIRFYLWSGTLLIPVVFIIVYVIIRREPPPLHLKSLYPLQRPGLSPWWTEPVSLVVLAIPFTAALYFVNKWYINKMYGRHIEKIKAMLREMDEE
jgi:hypothetical protein